MGGYSRDMLTYSDSDRVGKQRYKLFFDGEVGLVYS